MHAGVVYRSVYAVRRIIVKLTAVTMSTAWCAALCRQTDVSRVMMMEAVNTFEALSISTVLYCVNFNKMYYDCFVFGNARFEF
jgi:hypothetical protein